jgi:hypothetical protein
MSPTELILMPLPFPNIKCVHVPIIHEAPDASLDGRQLQLYGVFFTCDVTSLLLI